MLKIEYVNSYIEAYEMVSVMETAPIEKIRAVKMDTRSGYDVNAACDYAKKHYQNYNSTYPDWREYGGDCANFVSQCLYAGGKSMKGTPGTSSSAQNFSNWFSKGSTKNTKNVSSTWRGADAFRNYWQSNSVSYKKFSSYSKSAYDYGFRGDAVSLLNSNGRAYHTVIIFGYGLNGSDLIYAAHSSSTKTGSLKSTTCGFIIYRMN